MKLGLGTVATYKAAISDPLKYGFDDGRYTSSITDKPNFSFYRPGQKPEKPFWSLLKVLSMLQ